MTIKINYEPNSDRRWRVSSDEISRNRISQLVTSRNKIKDQLRFSVDQSIEIAFSVYGSLTKNKILTKDSAEYTDIDLVVFYDEDQLYKQFQNILTYNPESMFSRIFKKIKNGNLRDGLLSVEEENFLRTSNNLSKIEANELANFDKKVAVKTINLLINLLLAKTISNKVEPVSPESLELFGIVPFVLPISKKNETILKLVQKQRAFLRLHKSNESEFQGNGYTFQIASFFHLDLGGGLKPFIKDFLLKLKDNYPSEDQNDYWEIIKNSVMKQERGDQILVEKVKNQFPSTFNDALNYWRVDS